MLHGSLLDLDSSYSDFSQTSFKSKPMDNNYFQAECQMLYSNNFVPCLTLIKKITTEQ